MEFTLEDLSFLIECLDWSEKSYQEKSVKYHKDDGYLETIYRPKLKQFSEMKARFREKRKELKNENLT